MNFAKFLKRTGAILAVLVPVLVFVYFILVRPVFTYWDDFGFKALLLPVAISAIVFLLWFLFEWGIGTLRYEFDSNEDGKLSLEEAIEIVGEEVSEIKGLLDLLKQIKEEKDAQKEGTIEG